MKQAADRAVLEAATENAFEKGQTQGLEKGHKQGLEKGHKQGLKEGHKQGLEEGEKKKSLEIASAMLKTNLSVNQISELTGLSEKDIEILRRLRFYNILAT